MKNPLKEVKRKLLQWGRVRLIAINSVYNKFDPITDGPLPDPFEADEETIKSFGNSWAVDVWHDTNPGELQIKIDFNKINSSKDLKTYVLSLIEEYLEEHPEYRKRKRVKLDAVIDMLMANEYMICPPWPEPLRKFWKNPKDYPMEKAEFSKMLGDHLAATAGGGPKQVGKFLFKKPNDENIDSYRKRVERLLDKFDDVSETRGWGYEFSKLTYP